MKLFECQHCGQPLYFENIRCESCGRSLGYLAAAETISALEEGKRGFRALAERKGRYRYCANAQLGACNWLVSVESPEQFCAACRHNRMIPDLSQPDNQANWRRIELAKHRLFYTLLQASPAVADQARGSRERPGVRFPRAAAAEQRAGRAGDDRPRQRPDHHQPRRGRRFRTRAHAPADGRALPHAARSFPPRDRALLLGSAGAGCAGHRGVPAVVRRRAARIMARRCSGITPTGRRRIGRSVSSPPTPARIRGRIGPKPGRTTSTWSTRWRPRRAFGMRVRPRVTKGADLSTAIDFDPHSAALDRIIDSWLPLTFAVNSINRSMGIADLYPFVLAPPGDRQVVVHSRSDSCSAAGPRRRSGPRERCAP